MTKPRHALFAGSTIPLAAAALLCFASLASAQSDSRLMLEPFPKELAVDAEAAGVVLEGGYTTETDNDFDLAIYQTQGKVRVDPGNLISPRVGYEFTYLDIHSDSPALPDRLVDQSIGIGFPVGQYEDWIFGVSLGVGYAGDGPFGDGDAWYGQASLVAFRQLSETSAIFAVLDYDGNRTIFPDVPLPGGGYLRRIGDNLELVVGLPVSSVTWRPNEQWTFEFTYIIPQDGRVDIGYEFLENWILFGRFRRQQEAFYLDGLDDNYDRVLFDQRRAEVGVRWEPREQIHLDVALGYAWGTEFSTGFDIRDTDELAETSDEPYVRAGVEVRF